MRIDVLCNPHSQVNQIDNIIVIIERCRHWQMMIMMMTQQLRVLLLGWRKSESKRKKRKWLKSGYLHFNVDHYEVVNYINTYVMLWMLVKRCNFDPLLDSLLPLLLFCFYPADSDNFLKALKVMRFQKLLLILKSFRSVVWRNYFSKEWVQRGIVNMVGK